MNHISLTLQTVAKIFNDKSFPLHVYQFSFTCYPFMVFIQHLVSQEEAIRLECFWLRLAQLSGISP